MTLPYVDPDDRFPDPRLASYKRRKPPGPEEEKARALAEEAETAGWSAGQLHEESVRRGGGCRAPEAEDCPRGGWILTDFDTWVACSIHGPGERHPEDG